MSRKTLPFMRLYRADYRRDTRHLTTEQHGAYLLVLMEMWDQQGGLPEGHVKRATELPDAAWLEHRDTLVNFFVVEHGTWKNRRLERELADIRKTTKKRVAAGKKGGQAKAANRAKSSDALASATAGLEPGNAETDVKGETASALSQSAANESKTESQQIRDALWRDQQGRRMQSDAAKTLSKLRSTEQGDALAVAQIKAVNS